MFGATNLIRYLLTGDVPGSCCHPKRLPQLHTPYALALHASRQVRLPESATHTGGMLDNQTFNRGHGRMWAQPVQFRDGLRNRLMLCPHPR